MAEVCGGPASRSQLPSYSTHFPFLILTYVRGTTPSFSSSKMYISQTLAGSRQPSPLSPPAIVAANPRNPTGNGIVFQLFFLIETSRARRTPKERGFIPF